MKHRIYVVGMGPGQENMMTQEAMQVLEASDVIIGYTVYLKLLGERFGCKELLSTPMRQERERCQMCSRRQEKAKSGIDLQRGCRNLRDGIPDAGNRKIIMMIVSLK